jgi:uncharacterized protein YbcI
MGDLSPSAPSPVASEPQNLLSEISREMVHLYKEQFGRGPVKSKTRFADHDCIVCTLEQSMTPAEKSQAAMGEDQRLRDMRMVLRQATEGSSREIVERLSGRRIVAFVSGIDTKHDVASEVFYLEPNGMLGPAG